MQKFDFMAFKKFEIFINYYGRQVLMAWTSLRPTLTSSKKFQKVPKKLLACARRAYPPEQQNLTRKNKMS